MDVGVGKGVSVFRMEPGLFFSRMQSLLSGRQGKKFMAHKFALLGFFLLTGITPVAAGFICAGFEPPPADYSLLSK